MMGGRAAETIIYDEISTGASDDINRATDLARRMVTELGMSEKLGWVRYAGQQLQYLGGVDGRQREPQPRDARGDRRGGQADRDGAGRAGAVRC